MACSRRCWALCATYFNIIVCIPPAIFLSLLLATYCRLTDYRQDYLDSFVEWYAKELSTTLMYFWVVLEVTGILICIRCIKGIYDVRTELVTQWLVWKSLLTGSYFLVVLFYFTDLEVHWSWVLFPAICFSVSLILLIIVFLYYQTMPDDSSDEEGF